MNRPPVQDPRLPLGFELLFDYAPRGVSVPTPCVAYHTNRQITAVSDSSFLGYLGVCGIDPDSGPCIVGTRGWMFFHATTAFVVRDLASKYYGLWVNGDRSHPAFARRVCEARKAFATAMLEERTKVQGKDSLTLRRL